MSPLAAPSPYGLNPDGTRAWLANPTSGRQRVAWEVYDRKIGVACRKAWPYLCALRAASPEGRQQGLVWISATGLAAHFGWHVRKAEIAIDRLQELGLLKPVAWRWWRGARVYMRRVYGNVAGGEIVMPRKSAELLRKKGSGGKRVGAGRPSKATLAARIQTGGEPNSNRGDNISPSGDIASKPYIPNGIRAGGCETTATSSIQESRSEVEVVDPSIEQSNAIGTRFGGGGHGGPFLPDNLPAYPGISTVEPARIPDPPELAPLGAEPEEQEVGDVEKLLTLYRSACEAKFKKRAWTGRGDVHKRPYYAALVETLRLLRQLEIAPAAWCSFSLDLWKAGDERASGSVGLRKVPPLPWVWSPKRLAEKRGYFRGIEDGYRGGRLVFGPTHKKLLERYAEMMRAVHASHSVEESQVAVERYFPPGAYENLIEGARAEAADNSRRLRAMVERGEWVWE
jgi:hypothetical protein